MSETKNWIIVDVTRGAAIYGLNGITMRFSTIAVAKEIADCLFNSPKDYILVELKLM